MIKYNRKRLINSAIGIEDDLRLFTGDEYYRQRLYDSACNFYALAAMKGIKVK